MPTFYSDFDVEDSLDGRFDLMSLHMAMLLDKLDQHQAVTDAAKLKRVLQEIMFDNLDLTLREIGVGDLGVGKKIKVMAEAFYGRMMVYQDLFHSKDVQKMSEALIRNLYREREIAEDTVLQMSRYVFEQRENIKHQNIENIMSGETRQSCAGYRC